MHKIHLLIILFAFNLLACTINQSLSVQDSAKPFILPKGAPKYSDVCFSSRWERPRNPQDTFETFSAANDFHATYFSWVYTTNPKFIKKADSLGYKMQVALGPNLPDSLEGIPTYEKGRTVNKFGQKATAPWMKTWGHYWGCVNNPTFQSSYFSHIETAIKSGGDCFHVDGPGMGFLLLRNKWEDVCYCEYCQKIADSLGVLPTDIQEKSVSEFHRKMKSKATELAGKEITFSSNNFEGDWELFPFPEFDFGVVELPERRSNPEFIYAAIREAKSHGKAQVFTYSNDRDWLTNKMIAATYAAGGNMIVPWDVYQDGGRERYFGRPEQYAPIYGFIRAISQWLDGYEDAFYATTQDEVRFSRTEASPVSFENYRRQIHVFVRAKPSVPTAPVVVHLIDWHVLMEPFSVNLNESRFFKKGIDSIELLTPVNYDAEAHDLAETKGDFSKLIASQKLDFERDGGLIKLAIPKLEHHWGLLIVSPKL